jgi:hypothetical protein
MSASPDDAAAQAAAAMTAALDRGREQLADEARWWAGQIRNVQALMAASEQAGKAGVPQFLHLEIAGSWQVSQSTAHRWMVEADRFATCLPRTLKLLESGALLRQQAWTMLKRTGHCSDAVARQVEAEVLSAEDALRLCPADLGKRIDTAVLRIEAEQADPAAAEQRHADAVAERRTFVRPETDGMGLAGAVLPAERLVAWQCALDALERRERKADREAGIERTADQRRADIFAALPAMVLTALQAADAARSAPTRSPPRSWSTCTCRSAPCSTSPKSLAAWTATARSAPPTPGCCDRPRSAGSWSTAAPADRSRSTTDPPRPRPTRPGHASRSRTCSARRSWSTPTSRSTTRPPGWPG